MSLWVLDLNFRLPLSLRLGNAPEGDVNAGVNHMRRRLVAISGSRVRIGEEGKGLEVGKLTIGTATSPAGCQTARSCVRTATLGRALSDCIDTDALQPSQNCRMSNIPPFGGEAGFRLLGRIAFADA